MLYKRGFSCFPIRSTGKELLFFREFSNVCFFSKTESVFASTRAKSKLSNRDFLMLCIFVLLVFMQLHWEENKHPKEERISHSICTTADWFVKYSINYIHTYIHTLSMAIGRPGPVQDLPDAWDKERWFLVVVQKPNCCQSHSSIFQSRLRFSTWGRQPQTSLDVDQSVCF